MKLFSKVLYESYGIQLKDSETDYFYFVLEHNNMNVEKSLEDFCNNCNTRYFKKSKINEISNKLKKEAVGRNKHHPKGKGTPPDGKGPAGNITNAQILSSEDDIYIEDAFDTAAGIDQVYIKNKNGDALYKDMPGDYVDIFARNYKNKKINN